jgi:CheY-like chemotaxis protein
LGSEIEGSAKHVEALGKAFRDVSSNLTASTFFLTPGVGQRSMSIPGGCTKGDSHFLLSLFLNTVSKKRILVVDDEKDIAQVVKLRLQANDYEVITAHDGQAALDTAKKEKPDLIILDIMLPKMDGYKVCGLLKSDSRYSKIPIIMFSAKAQAEDATLGKEVGADAYITKPFEPNALLSKIKELTP